MSTTQEWPWERLAQTHADSYELLVELLAPRPGERFNTMPRSSRAAELWTLLRRFGGGGEGDHPAEFSERVHELLGDWFELDTRVSESPAETAPTATGAWEYFLETFGPLEELVAELDADRVDQLRSEFVALRERWGDAPASSVLMLGRRR